jgi:hypothetical protein
LFCLQRLYDRLWFFVTESLLAFTIFRDDFDIPFALMFAFLLFVKSFHWLASDRIEWVRRFQHHNQFLIHIPKDGPNTISRTAISLSPQSLDAVFHPLVNGLRHVLVRG